MARKVDEFNLPNTAITRIVKEVLPENVSIGKDAKTALAKAASVFIMYITSSSNATATKNNRKTINGHDIIEATSETFPMFIDFLKKNQNYFKRQQDLKKYAALKQKLQKDGE
ncbi:hypothetical protein R5R35_014681 [Gryllus longicercus]|uniref:DNA polymerase epsilon subunit 3 n=1 Tax=Gryllus longicercus TaxID=2509291 RepID=A0AAN9Z2J8_9ORTH